MSISSSGTGCEDWMSAMLLLGFIGSLIVSMLITGAEFGVGTISRDSLERLAGNRVRGASLICALVRNKRRFMLMFISGRIIAITAGTLCLFMLLTSVNAGRGVTPGFTPLTAILVAACSFIITERVLGILVSLGEYEDRVTRFSYFIVLLHVILFPLTFVFDRFVQVVFKEEEGLAGKEEAFMELVKSESESGVIEVEEREMIQSIFEFSDTTVKEVMVPRIDVAAAEKHIGIDELFRLFQEKGHSRIPVFEDRIDNILGVIYAKDLLIHIAEKGKQDFSINDIMREAYFVPESKKLSELLKEFKKNKVHIAVVVDEYGGTAGIVALEDVIEEIVGDIQDEYDSDERDYVWITDTTLVMDAGLSIGDVNETIRTNIPDEHFDTLGGFLYNQLGIIPEGGEEVVWEDVTFTVKEILGNRIAKVLVKLKEPLVRERPEE